MSQSVVAWFIHRVTVALSGTQPNRSARPHTSVHPFESPSVSSQTRTRLDDNKSCIDSQKKSFDEFLEEIGISYDGNLCRWHKTPQAERNRIVRDPHRVLLYIRTEHSELEKMFNDSLDSEEKEATLEEFIDEVEEKNTDDPEFNSFYVLAVLYSERPKPLISRESPRPVNSSNTRQMELIGDVLQIVVLHNHISQCPPTDDYAECFFINAIVLENYLFRSRFSSIALTEIRKPNRLSQFLDPTMPDKIFLMAEGFIDAVREIMDRYPAEASVLFSFEVSFKPALRDEKTRHQDTSTDLFEYLDENDIDWETLSAPDSKGVFNGIHRSCNTTGNFNVICFREDNGVTSFAAIESADRAKIPPGLFAACASKARTCCLNRFGKEYRFCSVVFSAERYRQLDGLCVLRMEMIVGGVRYRIRNMLDVYEMLSLHGNLIHDRPSSLIPRNEIFADPEFDSVFRWTERSGRFGRHRLLGN